MTLRANDSVDTVVDFLGLCSTTMIRHFHFFSCGDGCKRLRKFLAIYKNITRSSRRIPRYDSYLPGLSLCKPTDKTGRCPVDDTRSI